MGPYIKNFQQNIETLHDFSPRNVTDANRPFPHPKRPYDVSCGQNRYVTLPFFGITMQSRSLRVRPNYSYVHVIVT